MVPSHPSSIVMEFANGGDLAHKISELQKKGTALTETELWSIFVQIVKGLGELHRMNIFHRDINCLLYTSPSPRDLSTSRMPSSA